MAARVDGIVPIRPFEVPWETRYCASLATPRSTVCLSENFSVQRQENRACNVTSMQTNTDVNMCCSENIML